MHEIDEELAKRYAELQEIPPDVHLLCPKTSEDDEEDYRKVNDPDSSLPPAEKQKRIQDGEKRVELTYWNSLILGFDKKAAGKWGEEFRERLDNALRHCSDCVLNWHMKRQEQLHRFSDMWGEDTAAQVEDLLRNLDIARIDHNLTWAKNFIEHVEQGGKTFKRSNFGDKIAEVHIAVYEALCCVAYMAEPERRTTFQFVFLRLQGKTYLKLGTKDPLPGMVYFLFDQKNEDRRNWAFENWKNIETDAMDERQFDWAVSGALVSAMDDVNKKDPTQAVADNFIEIERFWLGFEKVLRTLTSELILERLRNLEVKPGCPDIYNLLFRHIQWCRSEGILVITLRVLTSLLKKSPRAFWDVIGDAKPNVVADLILASPLYSSLLKQSLDKSLGEPELGTTQDDVPFSTSWVAPWLQSLGRDRRYDACEVLLHTLFETLAKDETIGEAGQAACIRAGFDALAITVETFVEQQISGTGSTHLYANCAFNLVVKHKHLLLSKLENPTGSSGNVGWKSFNVGSAAKRVFKTTMKLDTKLFSIEFHSLRGGDQIQSSITRESKAFWEGVVEMFESSSQRTDVALDFLLSLDPLIRLEPIRPKKKESSLPEPCKLFNERLSTTMDALCRFFSRVSALDEMELTNLFSSQRAFEITVGIAMQGESDIGEASAELLKNWTGELARSQAFEQMVQLHPEQTLGATLFVLDKVFRAPGNFSKQQSPWTPIRPILHMSRDLIRGLCDDTHGLLRVKALEPRSVALLLRWWQEQWLFVSRACRNIESWSFYITNAIMEDFCRDIMELAEALIAEDGLLASVIAKATNKSEAETMQRILKQPKDNFQGMENMIRLKDRWLIDVTVRVLCKILKRLRESDLEIAESSRQLIIDSCVQYEYGKYRRITNLTDRQRAELLQALGYVEEEIQKISLPSRVANVSADKVKKQSSLEAWSKSGKTNRDDVLELSKSIDSPILKQLEAKKAAEAKAKAKAKAQQPDQERISALKESRQREKELQQKRKEEAVARAKIFRGGQTVAGEGSGLAGLSVAAGKEHTRSEIMVNSSDEESEVDSDSDGDDGLAMLSTGTKKVMDEAEKAKRRALVDKTRRPVKKVKQQRSVKEMRARLIPPMDKLHNAILAWNIFHDGNDPPSGPSGSSVATKYSDPKSYQQTFFPLLLSEAWRSFVTAKDEITSQPFGIKVASRATVDSFLEATFTMPVVQGKDRGVSEGDILLISEGENPLLDPHVKHCLARVHRITYKKDLIEVTYRVASRNNPLSQALNPGVSVYGVKITNMTTIEREYAALESLQYYDLMDEIISAEPSPILRYSEEKVDRWQNNWELNRGQALAVMGAQDNDGFTLIQGPPGTGKTKTIVAMVGALLSEQLSSQKGGAPVGVPLRPTNAPAPQMRSKKLLVCAPSNAAVDELVLRLKAGVKSIGGKHSNINVLRLGRSDAINASVRDVTLDELVKTRLEQEGTKDKARTDREKLHADAGKIKEELSELRPQMEATRELDQMTYQKLSRRFDELKKQQMNLGKQIDANKDSGNSIAREMEMRRRQVQQEILNGAHVLCATLSGSGHEMFRNLDVEFETVIIDEAAQCVELSALIPLKYGCCKCILVGDPKQLPPTVLSQSAARYGYDQSLFVRMQQNHPKKVHLLDTQYRMHPHISAFPSREFYEGQLKDGPNMLQLRQQPWHKSILGPYRFFDVQGVQERGHRGQSLVNTKELEVAMQIYDRFRKDFQAIDLQRKIGIITPYKAQLHALRNRFRNAYGEGITDVIEFNTTDAFQGRECEIIIFSCVRASSTGGIGFMTDIRRMNVGLTRAKSSLWILGDSRALVQGEFWKKLIEDARQRDCYTHGDILAKLKAPFTSAGASTNDEIVMLDGPPPPSLPPKPSELPQTATLNGTDQQNTAPPTTNHGSKTATPRSGAPPMIHTSVDKRPHTEGRKRPLDDDSHQPSAKKIAATGSRMMGKFGQKPSHPRPQPPKPPQDPSAMAVLGMVPPERPAPTPPMPSSSTTAAAPRTTSKTPSNTTTASRQTHPSGHLPPKPNRPPQSAPRGPKPKTDKKAGMFVPRKR